MENYKTITREELKKWMDEKKDFVLIDVMSQGSYEGRHLPNAKHAAVSETDFMEKVEKLVSTKETVVVVYCASFSCQLSPHAASMLADAGHTNVYDFKGGLADWQDAKYPFSAQGGSASGGEEEGAEKKVEPKGGCCN